MVVGWLSNSISQQVKLVELLRYNYRLRPSFRLTTASTHGTDIQIYRYTDIYYLLFWGTGGGFEMRMNQKQSLNSGSGDSWDLKAVRDTKS